MTVVKSVSDGLRDSETQLNLNRPLRISPGPWPPEPSLITCLGALNAQKSGKIFQKKKINQFVFGKNSSNTFSEASASTRHPQGPEKYKNFPQKTQVTVLNHLRTAR